MALAAPHGCGKAVTGNGSGAAGSTCSGIPSATAAGRTLDIAAQSPLAGRLATQPPARLRSSHFPLT